MLYECHKIPDKMHWTAATMPLLGVQIQVMEDLNDLIPMEYN